MFWKDGKLTRKTPIDTFNLSHSIPKSYSYYFFLELRINSRNQASRLITKVNIASLNTMIFNSIQKNKKNKNNPQF